MEFIVITLIKFAIIAFVLYDCAGLSAMGGAQSDRACAGPHGSSRVGPHGLLQPLADVVKLITKEGVMPPHVNNFSIFSRRFLPCSWR